MVSASLRCGFVVIEAAERWLVDLGKDVCSRQGWGICVVGALGQKGRGLTSMVGFGSGSFPSLVDRTELETAF